MKMTPRSPDRNASSRLHVGFDVGRTTLNCCFEIAGDLYEDEFRNLTPTIEKKLEEIQRLAAREGFEQLEIVCEPTGGYHNKLLRTARRLGHHTSYVNVEAVSKFRVVESNDSGKSDVKDPRVIATLARLGKTLKHRVLSEGYLVLRRLGRSYDEAERELVRCRCRIHDVLKELFCDYSFKKDFLYGASGRALVSKYGLNPYRIVSAGKERFRGTMKRACPRVQNRSIERLWQDAVSSSRNALPGSDVELLEEELRELWREFLGREQRRKDLGTRLEEKYAELRNEDKRLPEATSGVISAKNLARIVAETGPLSDFADSRKLLRYAGLNLRQRQSGQYEGQTRISKKGRPLLRKVLSQVALPLVRRGQLFGDFYHKKREKMAGIKAMTTVVRQLLRKLFGWYRSGLVFDERRFFLSESEHRKAA